MTNVDDLRKGDHVIVTLDAYFINSEQFVNGSRYISLGDGPESEGIEFCLRDSEAVTIEKVTPPLPAAVGSVVKTKSGTMYMLHDDGKWHSCFGTVMEDGELRNHDWILFRDAGVE